MINTLKKLTAFIIAIIILLSGCSYGSYVQTSATVSTDVLTVTNPGTSEGSETAGTGTGNSGTSGSNTAGTDTNSSQTTEASGLCNAGDVESDINSKDLSEDVELTKNAERKDQTEKDKLIETVETDVPSDDAYVDRVAETYNTKLPAEIVSNIKYSKYPVASDYLLIKVSSANIREFPNSKAKIVGQTGYFEKITVTALVYGEKSDKYKTDKWYKVVFKKGTGTVQGYILSSLADLRTFQFGKMYTAITALKAEVDINKTAFINNYKNRSGTPPLYKGKTIDSYGILRYQAAPAYVKADTKSDFRYIPDGTLVSITGQTGTFYKIRTLNFKGEYFVPKQYLSFSNSIDKLTKVIVVDRKNQNEGVFEYINGKWNIISYTYATTGELAKYKEPTPLGYFMAIQKRDKFMYLDDVTKKVSGYAPYAIRFSGGAYVHGVPVDVKIENGVSVFPPMQEYLYTIGTVPRSHKCVRNYTSHALFLYNWIEVGKSSVVVIE